MKQVWKAIESLDGKVSAQIQLQMLFEGRKLLERASRWLLHKRRSGFDIAAARDYFSGGIAQMTDTLPKLVTVQARKDIEKRSKRLTSSNVPPELARRVALFDELYAALDIVEVSRSVKTEAEQVAAVYFALDSKLDLHWMRDKINALPRENRWQALARAALRDDLYDQEAAITADVLRLDSSSRSADARILASMQANAVAVNRCRNIISDIRATGTPDFTMMSVAMREIRRLRAIESDEAK